MTPVSADSILSGRTRGGVPAAVAPSPQPGGGGSPLSPEASRALDRQRSILNRTNDAIKAMRAAQDAARKAASDAAGEANNALKPELPNVRDGLCTSAAACDPDVDGGLAAALPDAVETELTKWIGGGLVAKLPGGTTQVVKTKAEFEALRAGRSAAEFSALFNVKVPGGKILPDLTPGTDADNPRADLTRVTVKQEQERAIFSWDRFDVGRDTELLFDQAGNQGWVALNRIVGGLTPEGRRTAGLKPSQILGSIKADGTVLVLNQNGVIFGGSSQVNVRSLIATTSEIGRGYQPVTVNENTVQVPTTLSDRNNEFLQYGLLGIKEALRGNSFSPYFTESAPVSPPVDPNIATNGVMIAAGAKITAGSDGFLVFNAPTVENSGTLEAPDANVTLLGSASGFDLRAYDGTAQGGDANIRGVIARSIAADGNQFGVSRAIELDLNLDPSLIYSRNSGLIDAPRGAIVVGSNEEGGILRSTTSVSRNGSITVDRTLENSVIAITPDDSAETIPQDPASLSAFKTSQIKIGYYIGKSAVVLAPGGNVSLGETSLIGNALPGAGSANPQRLMIEDGAVIDVSGLKDILVPAERNAIRIGPLKGNELAESPDYRLSFLNGATVYIDPRITGVRSDGVAWVGSPLINAAGFASQTGIGVSELLTKGGSVTVAGRAAPNNAPSLNDTTAAAFSDTIVKQGALIDITGGWTRYATGSVPTTKLRTADGRVIDISQANPLNVEIVGFADGFSTTNARFGITKTFTPPLGAASTQRLGGYIEGRDAGVLQLTGSSTVFDGSLFAQAFAGSEQRRLAQTGTGSHAFAWDQRLVQANPAQLPAGGALRIGAAPSAPGAAPTVAGNLLITKSENIAPVSTGLEYGQDFSIVDRDRRFAGLGRAGPELSPRDAASLLPVERIRTVQLSDTLLSESGLSQFSSALAGSAVISADANVRLQPGAVFDITSTRSIRVDGSIAAPAGKIVLESRNESLGRRTIDTNPFSTAPLNVGSLDVIVNGALSVRGLWTNDFGASGDTLQGRAFLNGGSIRLKGAERAFILTPGTPGPGPGFSEEDISVTDISGSVLVNASAKLDLSSGGYVDATGRLVLNARGGSLSLINSTVYTSVTGKQVDVGNAASQRNSLNVDDNNGLLYYALPSEITARVNIDQNATVLSAGFGGGGTFELITPAFAFDDSTAAIGTNLPLDFINKQGFQNYSITSYKMNFLKNDFYGQKQFDAPIALYGGFDAFLATQTVTIKNGETLRLRNLVLPTLLSTNEAAALQSLGSGGDILNILSPTDLADTETQNNAFYRQPVNLSLGGLLELKVEQGGQILGEAGAALTTPKLINEGLIRLPGGSITQLETPPGSRPLPLGVRTPEQLRNLLNADTSGPFAGFVNETAASKVAGFSNAGLVFNSYFLGELPAEIGVKLAPGSITDLSGVSLRDPLAQTVTGNKIVPLQTGRILSGGSLVLTPAAVAGGGLYNLTNPGRTLVADAGAVLKLSGASDVYQTSAIGDGQSLSRTRIIDNNVWSAGGRLSAPNGFTLTGAEISAFGGDDTRVANTSGQPGAGQSVFGGVVRAAAGALELGGQVQIFYFPKPSDRTLATTLGNPVLTQMEAAQPVSNTISANQIERAGFDTLILRGGFTTQGDVSLNLGRSFFVTARPIFDRAIALTGGAGTATNPSASKDYFPVLEAGGNVRIEANYIRIQSLLDRLISTTAATAPASATRLTLAAGAIDIVGAMQVGASIGETRLESTGDIRLSGVVPYTASGQTDIDTQFLRGQIASVNDLTLAAARIYPTTGSDFLLGVSRSSGSITFAPSPSGMIRPEAPYSAGASLTVQAANIVQGGALFTPHGTLNLGSTSPSAAAPATQSLIFTPGSLTSVSGGSISIPYGATTDLKEWFFAPTQADALVQPPAKVLSLAAANVDILTGATLDLSGGGDVFAYEFVPGPGGSRDVLNQLNPDPFTSRNGTLYPDGRQVYAIVPGLSDATVAAYDPIFSANYSDLGAVEGAGRKVYLEASPGLPAGWYTLLPAQYAVLPGGIRVVERTGAAAALGQSASRLADGTVTVAGRFGQFATEESRLRLFDVQSQEIFQKYSRIALTSASTEFARRAESRGVSAPRLPLDAGQISIAALSAFKSAGRVISAPQTGGRGAIADVSGNAIYVTTQALADIGAVEGTTLPDGSIIKDVDGVLRLCINDGSSCADGLTGRLADTSPVLVSAASLVNLNAESLLIGGRRGFQTDGTVLVKTSAQRVVIANDADSALTAPEILLAAGFAQNEISGLILSNEVRTSGQAKAIVIADGAVIEASGVLRDISTADYIATGGGSRINVVLNPDGVTTTLSSQPITAGAFLRISIGPDRFIRRDGIDGDADLTGLSPLPSNALLADRYSVSLSIDSGATLKGASILADVGTYRNPNLSWKPNQTLTIGSGAVIETKSLSLSAGQVAFAEAPPSAFNGLLITDSLARQFTGADRLTIASNAAIAFAAGERSFGDIRLLTPGLRSLGGNVDITATRFELGNRQPALAPCVGADCGSGRLSITAAGGTVAGQAIPAEILFGSGVVSAAFADGVVLDAKDGIFAIGGDGGLNIGGGALTMWTPIIADRQTTGQTQPRAVFNAPGAITVSGTAGFDLSQVVGTPGASLRLEGASVQVSGARLRATSGALELVARTGDIRVGDGAILETPGFDQVFGTLDPVTKPALGGRLRLESRQGNLFADATTKLSVGGGAGAAGTLELIAPAASNVDGLLAALDGKARTGGAGLTIDLGTTFDFTGFAGNASALGFTGALDITTRTGNLVLDADDTLRAESVKLTAEGGLTEIFGTIDTSGTRGGDIALFGRSGVALRPTAQLIATAQGYGYDAASGTWRNNDSRVATAGSVTLGTDGAGAITVDAGAAIDLRALQTETRLANGLTADRAVPILRSGVVNYLYAEADRGGTLTFRAPASGPDGASTVNVTVASATSVKGARQIDLEGFKRFDLSQIAGIAGSGATLIASTNTIEINPTGSYFSSATQAGGIVPFIQNFRLSQAARERLGGLASLTSYRETPGVDLAFEGNITLTRNWNLGAGTVNIPAARAAGLIRTSEGFQPVDYVVVEREDLSATAIQALEADLGKPLAQVSDLEVKDWVQASLFSRYTSMVYRTGASPFGQAPKLSLRAGGNLTLNGSVSDGFFSFREQTSDSYITSIGGQPSGEFDLSQGGFIPGPVPRQAPFVVPYAAASNGVSPAANQAAARDSFGSMELFPRLLQPGNPAGVIAASSSLNFTAGSALARNAGAIQSGLDPRAVRSTGVGNLTFGGTYSYNLPFYWTGNTIGGSAPVSPLIRTGAGAIALAASGTVDLRSQELLVLGSEVGGARVYTAGARADTSGKSVSTQGERITLDTSAYIPSFTNFARLALDRAFYYEIENSTFQINERILLRNGLTADPVFASGGGDVSVFAGGDVLARRDFAATNPTEGTVNQAVLEPQRRYIGEPGQQWRVGVRSADATARVNPQQFFDGVGTFGGGDIAVKAGGSVSGLSAIATASLLTADIPATGATRSRALITFGGGNVDITANADVLGGKFDVASGAGRFVAGRDFSAAPFKIGNISNAVYSDIRLADAAAIFEAGRDITLGGVSGLGVTRIDYTLGDLSDPFSDNFAQFVGNSSANQTTFYTDAAALSLTAGGGLSIINTLQVADSVSSTSILTSIANYPGTFRAAALTGNIGIGFLTDPSAITKPGTNRIVLSPNSVGDLELLAKGDISSVILAMEDGDPGILPGILTNYPTRPVGLLQLAATRTQGFPNYSPDATEAQKRLFHNQTPTHLNNPIPARIYAGGDITGASLSLPKQARIEAGRDIVNMMFFGQNLSPSDITSVLAGRDLTATTRAVNRFGRDGGNLGQPRPTVGGNSFAIGGPGTFILQAGRDAGPFLTSALPATYSGITPVNPYSGGILSAGNTLNPFLAPEGADISVRFGTGKGIAWEAFRDAYLDPANIVKLSGDYVRGAKRQDGLVDIGQRGSAPAQQAVTQENYVYTPQFIAWVKENAPKELAEAREKASAAGETKTEYEIAYAAFRASPLLKQQLFLQEIYFQELIATATLDNPSYLRYSRGYQAVNALFPGDAGYTRNALDGGDNTGTIPVQTGDLDLRLATIQTTQGGNIRILGPGGRVLAGSVVRTDLQAQRRNFLGVPLYQGAQLLYPVTAITRIPTQFEGVITVRGGSLYSFTDNDFLLNQSRAFTVGGGDLALWSSNADLNAGQGPKTSANFPPLVVKCNYSGDCFEDRVAATTGAGIAALQPAPGIAAPDVYLIAPRGTVDAGDAGVRVAGNLSIAALRVANADNFQVGGVAIGLPQVQAPNVGGLLAGSSAAAAGQQADGPKQEAREQPSIIIVEVIGYGGGDPNEQPCPDGRPRVNGVCPQPSAAPRKDTRAAIDYNAAGPVLIVVEE